MCQLFGLNSAQPVIPNHLLRGFFQRGGGSDHHADGWGLAYYDKQRAMLQVRDTAAYRCEDASRVLRQPLASTNIIAHVRKATEGGVKISNSHPFVRRLWERDWVFAHNGDLKDFHPRQAVHFGPRGDTDSERAFCFLLNRLVDQFGESRPGTDDLMDSIRMTSADIARHGICNFLLSDGEFMVAYCTTELYWAERESHEGINRLIDIAEPFTPEPSTPEASTIEPSTAETSTVETWNAPATIVATKPLTLGEPWHPMGRGELRIFSRGVVQHAVIDKSAGSAPESPVRGWTSGWVLDSMSSTW